MKAPSSYVRRFLRGDDGAVTVEYSLVVAMILAIMLQITDVQCSNLQKAADKTSNSLDSNAPPPTASPTPQIDPASPATEVPQLAQELGSLSSWHETRGRGPRTVSPGTGDNGGRSYGSYQLSSKMGQAKAFVDRYYPEQFRGLVAGSPAFTAQWERIAAADPDGLHRNEFAYIKETHYDPPLEKLNQSISLDANARSATLRDVLWSTSVQHGSRTPALVRRALRPYLANGGIDRVSDETIIKAIYAERGRMDQKGTLVHFRKSPTQKKGLVDRFHNEQADALRSLANEMK
ncbi:MAG: hypothetical protein WKF75_17515 [Singulisphaera sp.]